MRRAQARDERGRGAQQAASCDDVARRPRRHEASQHASVEYSPVQPEEPNIDPRANEVNSAAVGPPAHPRWARTAIVRRYPPLEVPLLTASLDSPGVAAGSSVFGVAASVGERLIKSRRRSERDGVRLGGRVHRGAAAGVQAAASEGGWRSSHVCSPLSHRSWPPTAVALVSSTTSRPHFYRSST